MKTIKILAIGNSFSQDATKFLHQTAKAAGIDTKIVNLYIGGCPLELHWQNIENNDVAYGYELNGALTERHVAIDEILEEEDWDYIVTQQASHDSGWINSYEPFLGNLVKHFKTKVPGATLCLHETWAYEIDSPHKRFPRYNRNQQEMYERLRECYTQMAEKYNLIMIPSGDVIQKVRQLPEFYVPQGGLSLCRDKFHVSYVYGRYLLACIWAKKLLGISVKDNSFVPSSVAVKEQTDEKLLNILREAADKWTE